ncbi:MAG: hypothetical protein H7X89_09235 [Rhizobiales bacterium]|nr:hypothetical protein [Hyphomicrobiales bacterium]
MKKMRISSILLSGTMAAAMFGAAATAADFEDAGPLPAVSGVNGKIELGGGWADIEELDDDALFYGGAALSFPVGDTFGLQFDVSAVDVFNDTLVGGNVHFFTRDPDSYLLGIVAGAGFADDADLYFVGPEAELYLGNFSIEAWGGYLNLDFDGAPSEDEFFAQVDLGLYATDDLRFTVGASSVADFESAHARVEWQIGDIGLPLSLTADAEIGEDDFMAFTAGIKIYFGAEDKSLIRRHREDDPPIRALSLFTALGNGAFLKAAGCDPEFGGGDDGGGDDGGCAGGGDDGGVDCLDGDPEDLAPPYCID